MTEQLQNGSQTLGNNQTKVFENRIMEEILPFIPYWLRKKRLKQEANAPALYIEKKKGSLDQYEKLSDDELAQRLNEEHQRAKAMDEKTFKMTLALTIGLTILGSSTTLMLNQVQNWTRVPIAIALWTAIFYSLCGGFIAAGALKTLPSYGYGTDYLIRLKSNRSESVNSLVSQEIMNLVRHLRNEAAYQCLRNGFATLFLALVLFVTAVSINNILEQPSTPETNQQLNTVSTSTQSSI